MCLGKSRCSSVCFALPTLQEPPELCKVCVRVHCCPYTVHAAVQCCSLRLCTCDESFVLWSAMQGTDMYFRTPTLCETALRMIN